MSEGNGFATRERLMQPHKRRYGETSVPDYGRFCGRSLTERERSAWEWAVRAADGHIVARKMLDQKCRLITIVYVDPNTKELLFNENDIPQIREWDSLLTNALVDFALKHCGISPATIEELEKNCEVTSAAS